jgi:hypothetical protein
MKRLLFFFLFIIICANAFAGDYFVITFSEKRPSPGLFRRSFEPRIFDYLWIIPIDSLGNKNVPIYPFVIDNDGRYEERGKYEYYWLDIINHPTIYTKEKKFSLKRKPLHEELDSLYQIVYNHRTRILSFSYSFSQAKNKRSHRVTVYITPIKGVMKKTVSQYDNRIVYYSDNFAYQDTLFLSDEILKKLYFFHYIRIPYFEPDDEPHLYIDVSPHPALNN